MQTQFVWYHFGSSCSLGTSWGGANDSRKKHWTASQPAKCDRNVFSWKIRIFISYHITSFRNVGWDGMAWFLHTYLSLVSIFAHLSLVYNLINTMNGNEHWQKVHNSSKVRCDERNCATSHQPRSLHYRHLTNTVANCVCYKAYSAENGMHRLQLNLLLCSGGRGDGWLPFGWMQPRFATGKLLWYAFYYSSITQFHRYNIRHQEARN